MLEQYRQTSQRMIHVRKQEFKRFEISAEKNIISDYVLLLSVLNVFTVGIEEYYPNCNNLNDAKSLQVLYHYWNITLRLQVANQ